MGGVGRSRGLGLLGVGTLGAMALVAGCWRGPMTVPTFPVTGKVLVGEEPASGAFVVFHPVAVDDDSFERPRAQVRADGSFVVTTFFDGDGAPAGQYAVTVEWRKLIRAGGDAVAGPNVVPDSYGRPDSTPLKVTVAEQANSLPDFRIEARRRR